MNRLKGIYQVFNWKSLVIAFLAVSSTYICEQLGLTADFPLALITIAVVFPIVFSIGGAYKRLETALDQYGHMKAHGKTICFAARDRNIFYRFCSVSFWFRWTTSRIIWRIPSIKSGRMI